MLFLQIRQAEVALADGRLDEAYQLIQTDALRSHRRGQTLVTELIDKLVARAGEHLKAGRAAQALLDCTKAEQLGGNLPQVISLRTQIEQNVVENDRARRQQARAGMIETAAALVDSALARKDLDRAVAELVRARGNGCADQRLRQLDGNVRSTLQAQIEDWLNEGRLDQVEPLMDRLLRLDPEGLATQQLARAIEQIQTAWGAISRGQPDRACEVLQRLERQLPQAKWIKEARGHLATAEEALRAVRTGPLGMSAMDQSPQREIAPKSLPASPQGPDIPATGDPLPTKFIIQVDGAGSFLVVRQSAVKVGPISSSQVPDVALMTEPGGAVVTIERMDDDYFLRSPGSAGKLLTNGERIAISPRCRLIFNQPNPSSTTAVLDLSSGRFPRADMRRVILLDRDLIIGPGSGAHVRVDQLTEPIVLNIRDGRLWHRNRQIAPGATATIAGLSLAVTLG